jgi:hypothetical protein
MIRTSEAINELSEALVKAQAKFSSAIKDANNPQYRSKYADLSSVIAAMVPHLNSEGLAVMQHPALEFKGDLAVGREAFVTVTTRLLHRSGQWMESDVTLPAVQRDKFDAQSVGSAITYACRYALQSIGVLGREDDDGTAAVGGGTHEAAKAVGDAKVAELKKKSAPKPSNGVAALFYVPLANGNAELVNVKAYGETLNEVAAEGLRQILKKYVRSANGDLLVANDKLDGLTEELKECGVEFRQMKAANA